MGEGERHHPPGGGGLRALLSFEGFCARSADSEEYQHCSKLQ